MLPPSPGHEVDISGYLNFVTAPAQQHVAEVVVYTAMSNLISQPAVLHGRSIDTW